MNAQEIIQLIHGKWHGNYGTGPCPVCQIESRCDQNALTVADGRERLLLNCKKNSCNFRDILAALGMEPGEIVVSDPAASALRANEEERAAQRKAAQAAACWIESVHISGTPAESYLRGRGITCEMPTSLRFLATCWHGPTAHCYPAMIAAVTSLHGRCAPAVHRTYVRPDGSGKAGVDPVKMMLGRISGGAVALSADLGPLVVVEGIETGLSLLSGLLHGPATVLAALSTSGVKSLSLPSTPGRLIVAADGDAPGREAAKALGGRATALGWEVKMLTAPLGRDWNDVLRECAQ
jgi:Toprim domain